MYDKDIDGSYEQWKFLEKFRGLNAEFSKEILRVAEEEDIELREIFGKAISNMLKNGEETEQIIQYATDCFSIGTASDVEKLQLCGMKEPADCWTKAYLVGLGEELWQIKFAVFTEEDGASYTGYSKILMHEWVMKFDEETGDVVGWNKPPNQQMVDIEELRGI